MKGKIRYSNLLLILWFLIFLMQIIPCYLGAAVIDWTAIKNQVKFEYLTTEDGLSQSSVLCVLQDKKGFMWFGTEDGLNRFDGYQFVVFRPEPDNPASISSNRIFCLYEDKKGYIWIGTNGGGLNRYDSKTSRFTSFRHTGAATGLSDDNINCICEDRQGNLWLGTIEQGINILTPSQRYKEKPEFIHIKHVPDQLQSLSNDHINSIYEDKQGIIWIGTEGGGLNKLLINGSISSPPLFRHYQKNLEGTNSLSFDVVKSINEDKYNMLWIGTRRGLFRFDSGSNKFSRFSADRTNPNSLSHNYVQEIYSNQTGLLWVGTDGGGLNKVILGEEKDSPVTFVRYKYDPQSPKGLNSTAVESICEDRSGVLWIGCYTGGINKIVLRGSEDANREVSQFVHLKHETEKSEKSISHDSVKTIWQDHNGNLWVGTDGGGLNKIMANDSETNPLTYLVFKHDPKQPHSLSNDTVTAFSQDQKGNIWIGTYVGGLNLLLPKEQNKPEPMFVHFQHDVDDPQSLSHNFVYSIYEDREGEIWVGTMGGGLNRFNKDKKKLYRISKQSYRV